MPGSAGNLGPATATSSSFGAASRSADPSWGPCSASPRSPVFEPLYTSDEDDEAGPGCGHTVESALSYGRSASCDSLSIREATPTAVVDMSAGGPGASLRSRGPGRAPIQEGHADAHVLAEHDGKGGAKVPVDDPAWRLFVLSFAAAWSWALVMYFFAFASHTVKVRGGEQHLLTANSLFVRKFVVSSEPRAANTLPQTEPLDATLFWFFGRFPRSESTVEEFRVGEDQLVLPSGGSKVWALWLNKGSTVRIEYVIPVSSLKFLILEGSTHLERWKQRPFGSSVAGKSSNLFIAAEDGTYFVALGNPNAGPVGCDFQLSVSRRRFVTSLSAGACNVSAETSCEVMMPIGLPMFAVLETFSSQQESSDSGQGVVSSWSLRLTYNPRVLSYMVLLAWPFGVAVLAYCLSTMQQGRKHRGGPIFLACNVLSEEVYPHPNLDHSSQTRSSHHVLEDQDRSKICESSPLVSTSTGKLQ